MHLLVEQIANLEGEILVECCLASDGDGCVDHVAHRDVDVPRRDVSGHELLGLEDAVDELRQPPVASLDNIERAQALLRDARRTYGALGGHGCSQRIAQLVCEEADVLGLHLARGPVACLDVCTHRLTDRGVDKVRERRVGRFHSDAVLHRQVPDRVTEGDELANQLIDVESDLDARDSVLARDACPSSSAALHLGVRRYVEEPRELGQVVRNTVAKLRR